MLSGMLFQLSWNPLPTNLEQGSSLALTRREFKKLTTSAYRVGNERWRLEVGRVSG
ncbi:thioesterase [Hoylesella loescheii]|uniref:thioesterase n=1 Tax=Hoylesella loescheii TaxID=840 RepID=UPI0026F31412|nr:thioesterase [Hoylesella loescheii]